MLPPDASQRNFFLQRRRCAALVPAQKRPNLPLMTDPGALRSGLAAQAANLGFDLFGITPAAGPDRADYIRRWIALGRHGGMTWLAANIERRLDPGLALPGARCLVMLGMNYRHPAPPHQPQIAAYARGSDYHRLIEPRLKTLARWLACNAAARTRIFVDTGPLIERDAAARASLGWIGKSTMLISPRLGTHFFIAALLTDAPLPADKPAPDRCGRCVRCIHACPTGAIIAPYQLDARLCIAYLTIEHRGPIPPPLRPLVGTRVFGCDDCLDACPWNRFARASRESALAPRPLPPLKSLLRLSHDEFQSLFRHSPIRRATHEGLLRNVCIALGNTGSPDPLPELDVCAHSASPLVAEHAAWAIHRIRTAP